MQSDPLKAQVQALSHELQSLKTTVNDQVRRSDVRLQTIETQLRTLVDVDEEQKLRERVDELDNRLTQLRARLAPEQKTIFGTLKNGLGWAKDNWTFLAFVVSIASIIYVYNKYGVSYFESYKNIANTKESAKRYKTTGDELLLHAEFKAADEAYQTAVAIDPSFIDAREGLMRTQILNSVGSFGTYTPVAVEAKLKSLEKVSPQDYLIPYIRGIIKIDQDSKDEARTLFEDSLKKNSKFVGNYIQLGYLDLFKGEFTNAKAKFKAALNEVPDHPVALYNSGLCDMLLLDFDSAITSMEVASGAEKLEIFLSLGEAYRNVGNIDMAVFHHEKARKLLDDPKLKEGGNYSRGTFNFFPNDDKDQHTPKIFEQAVTLNHYKALINYALSIDYALQGKFSEANKSFYEGYNADETINGEKAFECLYLNRSDFVTRRQKPEPSVFRWFSEKRTALDRNKSCELQEKRL